MRVNIFGLNKNWKEITDALYDVWCMHQSDVMLPRFCDNDFKQCFERVKKQYGYKELRKILKLS